MWHKRPPTYRPKRKFIYRQRKRVVTRPWVGTLNGAIQSVLNYTHYMVAGERPFRHESFIIHIDRHLLALLESAQRAADIEAVCHDCVLSKAQTSRVEPWEGREDPQRLCNICSSLPELCPSWRHTLAFYLWVGLKGESKRTRTIINPYKPELFLVDWEFLMQLAHLRQKDVLHVEVIMAELGVSRYSYETLDACLPYALTRRMNTYVPKGSV